VVGQIACGEHHTAVLTSTPWAQVAPDVQKWLRAEQAEYDLKLRHAARSNTGLLKKDLQQIGDQMVELQTQWTQEEKVSQRIEEDEQKRAAESVKLNEELRNEVRTFQQEEEKTQPKERPETAPIIRKTRRSMNSAPDSQILQNDGYQSSELLQASHDARANFLRDSSAMVKRMRERIALSGESATRARLTQSEQTVFQCRREYDQLRAQTRTMVQQLEEWQRKYDLLQSVVNQTLNPAPLNKANAQLQGLQMKLATVTIKISETEENRRNYALNISHLKEEELERFYQLEALRRQCAETDAFVRKMNEIRLLSVDECERAESELSAFRSEVSEFQSFVNIQLSKFQQLSNAARSRREARAESRSLKAAGQQARMDARVAKLSEEMKLKAKEAQAMQAQLESINERLRYFEKRFQQITAATGLTDPNEIINKFTLKEEMKQELSAEIKSKQSQITTLQQIIKSKQLKLNDAKSSYHRTKWSDVDSIQSHLRQQSEQRDVIQQKNEQLKEKIAIINEGIQTTITQLPHPIVSEEELNLTHQYDENENGNPTIAFQLLIRKLDLLNQYIAEYESQLRSIQSKAAQAKVEYDLANQQKIAADFAEKVKMTSLLRKQETS